MVKRWVTPVDGINHDIFEVSLNGVPVRYIGRYVKRATPQLADYLVLSPGESMTTRVDLMTAYDVFQSGSYRVEYFGDRPHSNAADAGAGLPPSTSFALTQGRSSVSSQVSTQPLSSAPALASSTNWGSITEFDTSCTSSQQLELLHARGNANDYLLRQAYQALEYSTAADRGSSTWYSNWFGSYAVNRYDTVSANMARIQSANRWSTIKFWCNCTWNVYAYVFPMQPYNINICRLFWDAPQVGTVGVSGSIRESLPLV